MSLEIIRKLDQLVPNPSCVYDTLSPILHSCEVPEDVQERTRISVGLSLCEFAAARVEYPRICLDQNLLFQCTSQLETRPTWWTTFSGNYRHISVICHEYKPHFEAAKFMGVFKNATNLFDSYQQEVEYFARDMVLQHQQLNQQWNSAAKELNNQLSLTFEQLGLFKGEILQWMNSQELKLQNVGKLANTTLSQLHSVSLQIEIATTKSRELTIYFDSFEERMDSLFQTNSKTSEALSIAAKGAQSTLEKTGKVIESYNMIITLVAKLIMLMIRSIAPLTVLGLLLCAYWFWFKKGSKRGAKVLSDNDLIFC